jgi:LruC domain-containing protein
MHYEVDHYLNGSNQVVSIDADWSIEAVGAGFHNGFGFEFDGVAANQVASVTGSQIHGDIVTNNSNGTEANQTNATIMVFENVYNHIQSAGGQYINCIPSNPYTEPVTISLNIAFNNPVAQSNVGIPPYDAFLFVNGNRSKEIHLPGNDPTDLADDSYLGSGSDASNPAQNYYYKTANGLPWAINISGDFDHPIELEPIDEAYLNFANWAASGGTIHKDWHLNISGNRNSSKIY